VLDIQATLASDKSGVFARLNAQKLKVILAQTVIFRSLDLVAILLSVLALVRWNKYMSSSRIMRLAWTVTYVCRGGWGEVSVGWC
jgi:hypothetical protein